ncbi:MAG: hypothetical protein GY742_20410 [Hyphomicrobiales bacterium]|nr:hypothetical protein [Hyphomicrobiales bacterium]
MFHPMPRPSITKFAKICKLVSHLRQQGVRDSQMAKRISEIGAIDLDLLALVLRNS